MKKNKRPTLAYVRKNIRLSKEAKEYLLSYSKGARVWIENHVKKAIWEQRQGTFISPKKVANESNSVIFSVRLQPDIMEWLRNIGAREFIEMKFLEELLYKSKFKEGLRSDENEDSSDFI